MTKELTQEDKTNAFKRATQSTSGAGARWSQRQQTGLTDEELEAALRYELGIFGGSGGRNCVDISYQGSGLKIWASWGIHNHCTDQPVFQGALTMKTAREVYGIKNPNDLQMDLF